ncbi:MAG: DUF4139 domain-containing protein [Acidobacteria bacterium]|nr:DUF4139 domain-containing protein [Acidobacteriota bacterium]MBI3655904.1 DUF4139 domain-containing protein [Acidobacteriota bacterium]
MKKTYITFILVILVTTLLTAAELPVRKIVLYKHGVGYFERSGRLGPGESARLDFKSAEMNDILKSLTITDKGGGKISGVRYDSSEPLERKLEEFPFRIGDKQPLSAVLDQLKGARLEMKFGLETIAGAIVGGRTLRGEEKQPEREQITLLLDSGEIRNFDLAAAAGLRFVDPTLQGQFKDYLAALAQSRSREKRSVYIDSNAGQSRQVFAGYMIPMPVWKSSYRLIFEQDPQPLLEGWAIIDNTTGEDWKDVQLSLVSGRPISFISRLYDPRYITRPVAELAEERAMAPVLHEGAVDEQKKDARYAAQRAVDFAARSKARSDLPATPSGMVAGGLFAAEDARAEREGFASSIGAAATARTLGELFEYQMPGPISIRKNESAMLPFLQQKTSARKLLIYSDPASAHPMNAVEITNGSGKTLDGGPLTIYDSGAYGGEALMETVKSGDKRLVSYAVDLGTRITTQFESRSDMIRELKMRRGVLTTRAAIVETKTYTIKNVDEKAKTLVIEHTARPQFTLLNRKPTETTSHGYRFEVKLAPGATQKFPVTEERLEDSSFMVANLTPDMLFTYVRNQALSESARKSLEQLLDLKRQVANTDNDIKRSEAESNRLIQDQDRLRQNISSLNAVSGQQQQVQDYAKKLAGQEGQLATLRDRVADLHKKKAALELAINAQIERIEF